LAQHKFACFVAQRATRSNTSAMTLWSRGAKLVHVLGRAGYASSAAAPRRGPIGHRPGDLLPSLAALIPGLPPCKAIAASALPWVKSAEEFFEIWPKLLPCMGKYEQFLSVHQGPTVGQGGGVPMDLKVMKKQLGGKAMSDDAQVAIAEFYLCVAFHMRHEEIVAAGSDNDLLLKSARACAEEDFEPFIERAREFVSDYDGPMHRSLEETCPLYEVDDGLFWRANFDISSASEFQHFLTALGHGSGYGTQPESTYIKPEDVKSRVKHIHASLLDVNDAKSEAARRAAVLVYTKWLQAASMPVKASISKALMEHGFLVSEDVHDSDKLLPHVPALWPLEMSSLSSLSKSV